MKNIRKILLCLLVLSALFLFGCDQGNGGGDDWYERQIKVTYDESKMGLYAYADINSEFYPSGSTLGTWTSYAIFIPLEEDYTFDYLKYNGKNFATVDSDAWLVSEYEEFWDEEDNYSPRFTGIWISINLDRATNSDSLEIQTAIRPVEDITINFSNLTLMSKDDYSTDFEITEPGRMTVKENTFLTPFEDLEDPVNTVVDYYKKNGKRVQVVYSDDAGKEILRDSPNLGEIFVHKSMAVGNEITLEAVPREAKEITINFGENIKFEYGNPYIVENIEDIELVSIDSGDTVLESMYIQISQNEPLPEEKRLDGYRCVEKNSKIYTGDVIVEKLSDFLFDIWVEGTEITIESMITTLPTYVIKYNDAVSCYRYNDETDEYDIPISSGKALIENVQLKFIASDRNNSIFRCWTLNGEKQEWKDDKESVYYVDKSDAKDGEILYQASYIPVGTYKISFGQNVKQIYYDYRDSDRRDVFNANEVESFELTISEDISWIYFSFEVPNNHVIDKFWLNGTELKDNMASIFDLYDYALEGSGGEKLVEFSVTTKPYSN